MRVRNRTPGGAMKTITQRLFIAALFLLIAQAAFAQTADEIIEKHLAAIGGRAALAKIKSRVMMGTITASSPVGDVTGSVEIYNQAPNKARTLIKIDLSAVGAGQMVQDQRFDGNVGFVMDTLQGNRDITGNQLDNMKNTIFPSALLNYKEVGSIELRGKEKVGDREAYLLVGTPKTGSVVRLYLDAESYLPIKSVVKVNLPQIGADVEQTTEMLDYRDVDGVKVPFQIRGTSDIQTYTINVTKVEHNTDLEQAIFSKP